KSISKFIIIVLYNVQVGEDRGSVEVNTVIPVTVIAKKDRKPTIIPCPALKIRRNVEIVIPVSGVEVIEDIMRTIRGGVKEDIVKEDVRITETFGHEILGN